MAVVVVGLLAVGGIASIFEHSNKEDVCAAYTSFQHVDSTSTESWDPSWNSAAKKIANVAADYHGANQAAIQGAGRAAKSVLNPSGQHGLFVEFSASDFEQDLNPVAALCAASASAASTQNPAPVTQAPPVQQATPEPEDFSTVSDQGADGPGSLSSDSTLPAAAQSFCDDDGTGSPTAVVGVSVADVDHANYNCAYADNVRTAYDQLPTSEVGTDGIALTVQDFAGTTVQMTCSGAGPVECADDDDTFVAWLAAKAN